MKAITIDSYGPPDVLQFSNLPDPQTEPGHIRVRIKAAGVQPVDCAVRSGFFADENDPFPTKIPQVLGNEFAGIVDQVGDNVREFTAGDNVLGWKTLASYAEYVVVSTDQVIHKPESMPWEVAGGLSGAGQAAHTAIEALNLNKGETVLIHAAAGAVGTVAVQLAHHRGTEVIGTASKPNHQYLRSLNAVPVPYGEGLADRVRAIAPDGVDAALDAAGRGALEVSVELINDRDRIVTLVDFDRVRELGVRGIRSKRSVNQLRRLAELYARGKLKIHIRKIFPFSHVADAHREVETGHGRGKVVLLMD